MAGRKECGSRRPGHRLLWNGLARQHAKETAEREAKAPHGFAPCRNSGCLIPERPEGARTGIPLT